MRILREVGTLGLVVAVAACLLPRDVAGQGRIGGQGVYQSELLGGTFGAGFRGQLDLGFLYPGLGLMGTYDYYFPSNCGSDCSFWEAGGSLVFSGGPGVFFGAGAAFQRFDRPDDLATTEDWITHFLIGLNLPGTDFLTPFLEARFEFASQDTNQVVFSAGALLGPRPSTPRRGGRR